MPEPETDPQPNPKPRNLFDRLRSMPGRTKLLLAVGAMLAVSFLFFRSCSGIEITEEDAVATALAEIDFEPERTEARVLRQGIPTRPVWVVVFTVPDPEGGRNDFLRHAAVRVDARTGELLDVEISQPDDG